MEIPVQKSDQAAEVRPQMRDVSEGLGASRQFWNEKARENPYWYVSSFGSYEHRNLGEFWQSGVNIWSDLKRALEYRPRPSDVVAEIGCGVGRLTRAIAPEVAHVHALDISAEMLAAAANLHARNVSFHRGNGDDLQDLPDGCADLVLAYNVFHHLPCEQVLARYLREMVRVAKPGGIIAFTMTPRTWHRFLRPVFQLRRWLVERFAERGPRDLYRHAWLGIRPSCVRIQAASPMPLKRTTLHGDKWLFAASCKDQNV
jgi:ubiquinone/menaquinone biosynthesis C-methylase UbiE